MKKYLIAGLLIVSMFFLLGCTIDASYSDAIVSVLGPEVGAYIAQYPNATATFDTIAPNETDPTKIMMANRCTIAMPSEGYYSVVLNEPELAITITFLIDRGTMEVVCMFEDKIELGDVTALGTCAELQGTRCMTGFECMTQATFPATDTLACCPMPCIPTAETIAACNKIDGVVCRSDERCVYDEDTMRSIPKIPGINDGTSTGNTGTDTQDVVCDKENTAGFYDGDGSEDDPYQICNLTMLQKIANDDDAHYILVSDIDASTSLYTPIRTFTGVLDGDGYAIRNLSIETNRYGPYYGLVAELNSGTIKNLGIEDINIYSVTGGTKNGDYVGGIAGVSNSNATIEKCYVTGQILGNSFVAGIVGHAKKTTFTDVYTTADITTPPIGTTSSNVGSIVGYAEDSIFTRVYSLGNVSGPGNSKTVSTIRGPRLTKTETYYFGNTFRNLELAYPGQNRNEIDFTSWYATGNWTNGPDGLPELVFGQNDILAIGDGEEIPTHISIKNPVCCFGTCVSTITCETLGGTVCATGEVCKERRAGGIFDGDASCCYGDCIDPSTICVEDWDCSDWSNCSTTITGETTGIETRECADLAQCGTNINIPEMEKTCTATPPLTPDYNCIENWVCGEWGNCWTTGTSINTKNRFCMDTTNCGTDVNKPEDTIACTSTPGEDDDTSEDDDPDTPPTDDTCIEDWTCEEWTSCDNADTQTRTCTDDAECGTIDNKPITTNACVLELCSNSFYTTQESSVEIGYNVLGSRIGLFNSSYLRSNIITNGYSALAGINDLYCLQFLQLGELTGSNTSGLNEIQKLANLTHLGLGGTELTDISFLNNSTKLEQLSIFDTSPSDFSVLNNLTKMKLLSLARVNTLDNISFVSYMPDLEYLTLDGAGQTWDPIEKVVRVKTIDLSPLANNTKLKSINIGDTKVVNAGILATLPSLEEVSLDYSSVTKSECNAIRAALPNLQIFSPNDCATKTGFCEHSTCIDN